MYNSILNIKFEDYGRDCHPTCEIMTTNSCFVAAICGLSSFVPSFPEAFGTAQSRGRRPWWALRSRADARGPEFLGGGELFVAVHQIPERSDKWTVCV